MTAPVVPGAEPEPYLSRNVRQAFIFSLTCWAAGLFLIDFPGTALMCLLRVPRFASSYLVILTAL